MGVSSCEPASLLLLATLATFVSQVHAADERAHVTLLADRWVAEYKKVYPISYTFSGLPIERHDGVDINSPADIARFREFQQSMSKELKGIDPEKFAGDPEWVTWHFLSQALKQEEATANCRNELWNVSAFGWQADLPQVAGMQPTGSDEARAHALTRWRQLGSWVDQEISNLKEGQRLGYVTTQASVKATIGQLDELLAGAPDNSGYMNPAERDKTPAFVAAWTKVVEGSMWPALGRYRTTSVTNTCRARESHLRSMVFRMDARVIAAASFPSSPPIETQSSYTMLRSTR